MLLASVTVCVVFFYKLETQKDAYETMRMEESERVARIASLTSLLETLDATNSERETIAEHVLAEDGVVDLLALIETLGREQDVLLSTETLTIAPINARFEELVATISVEGRYESVMRTFELLTLLPYETRIQSANLQQTTNNWRGVFDIRILKFKSI
jgi:Tfp pilus assembly protein PilO